MNVYGSAWFTDDWHEKTDRLMVTVEMKSVNHRFCEISIRLPRQWLVFEDKIKKAILPYVRRGKVEVFVTIAGEGLVKRKIHIDWDLLAQYWAGLQEAAKRFSLDGNVTTAELLRLNGAVEVVEEEGGNEEIEMRHDGQTSRTRSSRAEEAADTPPA
nr:YicC/YloC family endoribonuclease [Geobacillus sp. 47C-IIb]